jgi:L-galactose dehydrogenase/L-glyceraldehyde 3-phosphate reductase
MAMERRALGRTGLQVSVLGFGCGDVGGLMPRGAPADRERAVARALELGINYFDTAPSYGDGLSERHLGETLRALGATPFVGTKVRLGPADLGDMRGAVARSLEQSLQRLGLPRVDLLQLHNPIATARQDGRLAAADVLGDVVDGLEALRRAGKTRFYGITAVGETPALHGVVGSGRIDTAQVPHNLLNPSAGRLLPPRFPAQDFSGLLDQCRAHGVGAIAIRVLAGGALSGTSARHPLGTPRVSPIATGSDYEADVARARRLQPLIVEGHATSLIEAALRFAISHEGVSTVLVGYSSLEQLETAAAAVARGPLPAAALDRLRAVWGGVGEARR